MRKRRAAKMLGIDPKILRQWAPDPKTFYPRGHLRQNVYPGGKSRKRGGFFFFSKKTIPPGENQRNHAPRPKSWGGGG